MQLRTNNISLIKLLSETTKALTLVSPPERLSVSEFADKYRILSAEFSSVAGRWETSLAMYQKGIMDAVSDPTVERVVVMSSAQIGKTEILLNVLGYYAFIDPSPILFIFPTKEFAESFSKERLDPFIRDNDHLGIFASSTNGASTMLLKRFIGGYCALIGANNAKNLSSRPIRVILADEVDRYPYSAGKEGDPIELAVKRTATYFDRKIVMVSTPTIKGNSRIEKEYSESDSAIYLMPCVHCGVEIAFTFNNIIKINDDIVYKCEYCGGVITDKDKIKMVKRGKWVPQNPSIKNKKGFYINEMYSTWRTFSDVYKMYQLGQKYPEQMQVFYNTSLGLPYSPDEVVIDEDLSNRKEVYNTDIPEGVVLLTAGVDIQKDRFEITTLGWGVDEEIWVIEHKQIWCDTMKQSSWDMLDGYLMRIYKINNTPIRVSCTCIDSGFLSNIVYKYVMRRETNRIYAIKGVGGERNIVSRPSINPTTRCKIFPLGVDKLKDIFYNRLKISKIGAGYIHFNNNLDDIYFKQLQSEKIIYMRSGMQVKKVYKQIYDNNEALDTFIYAMAAYYILSPNMALCKKKLEQKINEQSEKQDVNIITTNTRLTPFYKRRQQKKTFKVHEW